MRIGKINNTKWIGIRVRKPEWSCCSGIVLDIGTIYVVLQIFDHEEQKVIGLEIRPKEEDHWETYIDASKLIESLPVQDHEEK